MLKSLRLITALVIDLLNSNAILRSPLISCRMTWRTDENEQHDDFDAGKTTFEIDGLPQGTLVEKIRLRCSNEEQIGLETHPTLSARTHGTTPPRISEIDAFSTAAGELSHDQSFTVDDEETHPASLVVRAVSLNESIVPSRAIEIRGVGRDRTVRVEPLSDVDGVAVIRVTVKDREGLTASTSFELTVAPNWFYFFPTKGYAGSSTIVTIHGAGFKQDELTYTCRLHSATAPPVSSDAVVVSKAELVCKFPPWPSEAQTIMPQLLRNGFEVKQSQQAVALARRMSSTFKTQVLVVLHFSANGFSL